MDADAAEVAADAVVVEAPIWRTLSVTGATNRGISPEVAPRTRWITSNVISKRRNFRNAP